MSFILDDNGRRHHTLDAEPGIIGAHFTPPPKPAIARGEVELPPHLMTRMDGRTVAAPGGSMKIISLNKVRFERIGDKTLHIDLGNQGATLTFATSDDRERVIQQIEIIGGL